MQKKIGGQVILRVLELWLHVINIFICMYWFFRNIYTELNCYCSVIFIGYIGCAMKKTMCVSFWLVNVFLYTHKISFSPLMIPGFKMLSSVCPICFDLCILIITRKPYSVHKIQRFKFVSGEQSRRIDYMALRLS